MPIRYSILKLKDKVRLKNKILERREEAVRWIKVEGKKRWFEGKYVRRGNPNYEKGFTLLFCNLLKLKS